MIKARPIINPRTNFMKVHKKTVRKIKKKNDKVKRVFGKTMRKYIK